MLGRCVDAIVDQLVLGRYLADTWLILAGPCRSWQVLADPDKVDSIIEPISCINRGQERRKSIKMVPRSGLENNLGGRSCKRTARD